MSAYSTDLRERVLGALDRGMSRPDAVQTFQVSLASLKRYLKQRRDTGDLTPKRPTGRPAHKSTPLRAAIVARLTDAPDATLEDHCDWWQSHSGVRLSTATMSRTIKRAGWTRKKSRWVPANGTSCTEHPSENSSLSETPTTS